MLAVLLAGVSSGLSAVEVVVVIVGGILGILGGIWGGSQFRRGSIGNKVLALQEANVTALKTQNDLQAEQIKNLEADNQVKQEAIEGLQDKVKILSEMVQSKAAVDKLGLKIDAYFKEMGVKLPDGFDR